MQTRNPLSPHSHIKTSETSQTTDNPIIELPYQEIETGTFTLDLSKIPSLKILPRAVKSRTEEVEVFFLNNELTLYAKDPIGNVTYILKETETTLKKYESKNNPTKTKQQNKSSVNDFESILINNTNTTKSQTPFDNNNCDIVDVNDQEEDLDDFMNLLWNNSQEIPIQPANNSNHVPPEPIKQNVKPQLCHFATSTRLLTLLSELKKVTITVTPTDIIIEDYEMGVNCKLQKVTCFTRIEDIDKLLSLPEWEPFPTTKVKSTIPVIEQIEDAKYRQFLTIANNKIYTYSDIIAIETDFPTTDREYQLSSEVLRVLKYATSSNTEVNIAKLEDDSTCLNMRSLTILFGTSEQIGINLFDIPRQIKHKIKFISNISPEFINKIKLIKKIYPDEPNINIEIKDELIHLYNDKIKVLVPSLSKIHEGIRIIVDVDKLLLAIRIADNLEAPMNLYETSSDRATIVLEGDISVLIDTEEYYK